ncbi:MAG: tryptophan--tRNA ligase [Bacteroidia bacterium]|jgi:tryptophanyl-tRNA synthetase|nr:tryptophan--tRNA ligase [Bacteroidia bacterium]MCC6768307.1 tryptophan--tRNA ligase [Bacteroidia bacterium]
METVVSGIRSTGHLHLGNYFGAIRNFIQMQHEHQCYFFIADLHALTTHPKPEDFRQSVRKVLVEYLAAGLDPEACTLYIQSDLPQIPELYLLLNMYAYVGELERCTSFKEKIRKHPDNINAGLLTYPVLMAADIIIHKATKVPVGKDQEQHLEMARNFVNRFNHLYQTEYFPEPHAYNFGKELVKVPGLDGSGKMGKSEGEGNAIFLVDEPEVIRKKVMRAVTDTGPGNPGQEMSEPVANLFNLLSLVSTKDTVDYFKEQHDKAIIRYGDLKKQLAEDIIMFTAPIREKVREISANDDYLEQVIALGGLKARESAARTLKEVRAIIGFTN